MRLLFRTYCDDDSATVPPFALVDMTLHSAVQMSARMTILEALRGLDPHVMYMTFDVSDDLTISWLEDKDGSLEKLFEDDPDASYVEVADSFDVGDQDFWAAYERLILSLPDIIEYECDVPHVDPPVKLQGMVPWEAVETVLKRLP